MLNLMNKDFIAESLEEELLCKKIEQIKNSKEVKFFIKKIQGLVNKDIKIFAYRIKDPKSAIRTFRLTNYKNTEQMHDLLGFLFVVENESQIEKLEKKIIKKINTNNIETYNLLKERPYKIEKYKNTNDLNNRYNEQVLNSFDELIEMPKDMKVLLPPFSYNILCKKKFKDVEYEVPIEFRIQTKEDFITTESYYYTVHKNDTIPIETKINLINICFRLLRRMTNLAFIKDDNIKEKDLIEIEINKIIKDNKDFIKGNKEIMNLIFSEHSRILNCWKNKLPIYEFEIR